MYSGGNYEVTQFEKVKLIFIVVIVVYSVLKVNYFLKVNSRMGLMSILLLGVFKAVVPFLGFFFFMVISFSIFGAVLGSNHNLANSYVGANLAFGYFFQTFENGIGNISSPTINFLADNRNHTKIDYFIVFLIYLFWAIAQVMLLIILLNFVIALISQYYEDVMNSQVMHIFEMKQNLNQEHNIIIQF